MKLLLVVVAMVSLLSLGWGLGPADPAFSMGDHVRVEGTSEPAVVISKAACGNRYKGCLFNLHMKDTGELRSGVKGRLLTTED